MNSKRLMAYLVGRGITLRLENGRLRYQAPAGVMTSELKSLIREHRSGLAKHLVAEAAVIAGREVRPAAVISWPEEAANFCSRLTAGDLPGRFELRQAVEVVDPAKFLTWLHRDILRGSSGPRALHGSIQADLIALRRIVLEHAEPPDVVAVMFPSADQEAARDLDSFRSGTPPPASANYSPPREPTSHSQGSYIAD